MLIDIKEPLKENVEEISNNQNIAEIMTVDDLETIAGAVVQYYQEDASDCADIHDKMRNYLDVADSNKQIISRITNKPMMHYSLLSDACNEFVTTFINEFPIEQPVKIKPATDIPTMEDVSIALEVKKQKQKQEAQMMAQQGIQPPPPQGQPQPKQGEEPPQAEDIVIKQLQKERMNYHAKIMKAKPALDVINYQLTKDMPDWIEETQSMSKLLAATGNAIRKYMFDPIENIPVHKLINPYDFYVNKGAKSIEGALRMSEMTIHSKNEIHSLVAAKYFVESLKRKDDDDVDQKYNIIEMTVRLDLDGDGYSEPYIIWVEHADGEVYRIEKAFDNVLRDDSGNVVYIKPKYRYCHYSFMPNPEEFFGIGLGAILEQPQETLTGLMNLMIDAGKKATLGGGFYSTSANERGGALSFKYGEYKPAQGIQGTLRDSIFAMPTPEPSPTLMAMMQAIDNKANNLANLAQFNTDRLSANTAPTTAMIVAEESVKKLRAILRRFFLAMNNEIKKLVEVNAQYLNQQRYSFLLEQEVSAEMFNNKAVLFVSNKDLDSIGNAKEMAKAQYLDTKLQDPFFDPKRIRKESMKIMGFSDPDYYMTTPKPPEAPKPDPMMMAQMEMQKKQLELSAQDLQMRGQKQQQEMQLKAEKQQQEVQEFMAKMKLDIKKLQDDTMIKKEKNQIDRVESENEARESISIATKNMAEAQRTQANTQAIIKEVQGINVTNQQ